MSLSNSWRQAAAAASAEVEAVSNEVEDYAPEQAIYAAADAAVREIIHWLRHVDRLDEIPGAGQGMPKFNPLWDAATAIEREFSLDSPLR